MKEASKIIQNNCKVYLAKMRVKKLRQEKMDEEKTRRLQKHLDV
jgi:hypothetical protein